MGVCGNHLGAVTASLMQNMVQIHKKNTYSATKIFFEVLEKVLLGLSVLRAPTVGPYGLSKDDYTILLETHNGTN